MAEVKIAPRPPVACAGCYGQYPERTHVDFGSAIEGAQVGGGPRAPHVEWVVLCEHCIASAYNLLPEQADQREQLERRVKALEERCEKAENYASSLEDALAHRPDVEAPARDHTRARAAHARQTPHKRKPAPPNVRKSRYQPREA